MEKYNYSPTSADWKLLNAVKTFVEHQKDYCFHGEDLTALGSALGVELLGSGSFGHVFTHPTNPRLCFKIGLGDHHEKRCHWYDPWVAFASFCMRNHDNDSLVGVYSLVVGPDCYVALMERLTAYSDNPDGYSCTDHPWLYGRRPLPDDAQAWCDLSRGEGLYRDDEDKVQLLKDICALAPSARIDIHRHNVMSRDGWAVLTDPLAFNYTRKEALETLAPLTSEGKVKIVTRRTPKPAPQKEATNVQ